MRYAPTLPAGEGGHKSRKIPPKEWTDIAPFIITSNHYGNSVVRIYREVGAYDQETGYMWGVCNTPLPYRQERQDTIAEKYHPENRLTSPPFTDLCGY